MAGTDGQDKLMPLGTPRPLSLKRQQLLAWFRSKAPSLADAYEGAIRLLEDGDFPGRVHFVAHAVRDIADRLAFVLDPQLTGRRMQYANALDGIAKLWKPLEIVEQSTATQEMVTVEYRVAVQIDALVAEHRESRRRPSNYELLFRFLARSQPVRAEANHRLIEYFKETCEWFVRRAHLSHKPQPPVDAEDLKMRFSMFEGMLHSFVGDFFTGTAELDEILHQANQ